MPMKLCWLFVMLLGAAVWAVADNVTPRAIQLPIATAWTHSDPVTLEVGEKTLSETLALPAIPVAPDQTAVMRFQARLEWPAPGGWNNYLAIALNGVSLAGGNTTDGVPRLVNRRTTFRTSSPHWPTVPVMEPRNGLDCLNVFFGPADTPPDPQVLSDRDEGYWYLLDVSDAVHTDGPNELVLTNTALAAYWQNKVPEGMKLVVSDLALGRMARADLARLRDASLVKRSPQPGSTLPGEGPEVVVALSGGIQVAMGGERFYLESSFSFPGDGVPGHVLLPCAPVGHAPVVAQIHGGVVVQADCDAYALRRTVTREGARIEVIDTITNKTPDVLGVVVEHRTIADGWPARTVLSGLDGKPQAPGATPENPTVFLALKSTGLGVVAEDDALRLQFYSRAEENTAVFGTENLGIAPGESYAVRWGIYPGSTEYFDFINAVRRDWGVNFTIEGPWDFFDVKRLATPEGKEAAKAMLARKKLKYFALSPWFEYYNYWGNDRESYKKLMDDARAFLRTVVPDAKFLACVETNLTPMLLSSFGEALPKTGFPIGREAGGKYGQATVPAMNDLLNATEWRDSLQRNAEGMALVDGWYVQFYHDPPALDLMVYPEFHPEGTPASQLPPYAAGKTPYANHRYKHALEQFQWLLDDVGFDGLYIDQFSLAFNTGDIRYSLDRWDGRTVRIGPDGRVTAKITDLGLVGGEARRAWVNFVLDRGKAVVANTLPAVGCEQTLHAARFMETQGYDPVNGGEIPYQPTLAKGQLGSPVGLGYSFPSTGTGEFFMRTLAAHLRFGMLYYYYYTEFPADGERCGGFGPVNHMFPFTPVELHQGWVLGKERLITCVSGTFPSNGAAKPNVFLFDDRGRDKASDAVIEGEPGKWRVTLRLHDWHEAAVVEAE